MAWQVEQLRNELIEKEETLSAENERLRLERNDIKERAKALWVDIENLRRERRVLSVGLVNVFMLSWSPIFSRIVSVGSLLCDRCSPHAEDPLLPLLFPADPHRHTEPIRPARFFHLLPPAQLPPRPSPPYTPPVRFSPLCSLSHPTTTYHNGRAAREAESHMSRQDAEGLKKLVDRLRRERNSARSDAMRWLEQQRAPSTPPSGADGVGNSGPSGVFQKTPGRSRGGLGSRARSAPDGLVNGFPSTEPAKVSWRAGAPWEDAGSLR